MQIKFLAGAKKDLRWFKQYYMQVFPEGRVNADRNYHAGIVRLFLGFGVMDIIWRYATIFPVYSFQRLKGHCQVV